MKQIKSLKAQLAARETALEEQLAGRETALKEREEQFKATARERMNIRSYSSRTR